MRKVAQAIPTPLRASPERGLARHPYRNLFSLSAESTALSFETTSLPGLCCVGHGERAAHHSATVPLLRTGRNWLSSGPLDFHAIVSDHNDGHACRNDPASRDSVADGMVTRLRYDEGGMDVGWSHRCGWRRH